MTAASQAQAQPDVVRPNLDHPAEPKTIWALIAIGVAALLYAAWSIYADLGPEAHLGQIWPFLMLGVALADRARLRIRQRLP